MMLQGIATTIYLVIYDSTGARKTGLTAAAVTPLSLVKQGGAPYSKVLTSGNFHEVDVTGLVQPGVYSIDLLAGDVDTLGSIIGTVVGTGIQPSTVQGFVEADATTVIMAALALLRGLSMDNAVRDQYTRDVDGNVTSCRLRCYDTAAHATAAGATGLLATYMSTATWSLGKLTSYTMVDVP